MIEVFRTVKNKKRKNIKIKYTDANGNSGVFVKDQTELLQEIQTILLDYSNQDITLTNRQLYYQLVAKDIIPNADKIYKKICSFITDARYEGHIDWEAIEDRGRVPSKASEWDNIKSLIETATASYRLPRWKDQPYYVELYCEKQAMESVLKPIADKYHIYFGVNKGYSSASTMYDLATRLKEQISNGKKTIVLYLGDHDSSGLDMIRDIQERISEFIQGGNNSYNVKNIDDSLNFEIMPLALNMKQIQKYKCPPNPAKITDPRAKQYIKIHGKKSWELDSLEPKVLRKITENGILKYLDVDKYNSVIQQEEKQKQSLIEYGEKQ